MIFIKYIDAHTIQHCPRQGISGGAYHTNLPKHYESHPEAAAADGYAPLIPSETPQSQEGYTVNLTYTLSDIGVVQSWEQLPQAPEPDPITDLELAIAELAALVWGGVSGG